MGSQNRIASVDEIPEESTLLVTLRDGFDEVEALLVRVNGEVICWRNRCQHWTDVRLDTGSGAAFRNGELLCRKHGATFDEATGECTHGPCEGAVLESFDVEVEDGAVYLAEDDYEFDHVGSASDVDLSSRGRIDF